MPQDPEEVGVRVRATLWLAPEWDAHLGRVGWHLGDLICSEAYTFTGNSQLPSEAEAAPSSLVLSVLELTSFVIHSTQRQEATTAIPIVTLILSLSKVAQG